MTSEADTRRTLERYAAAWMQGDMTTMAACYAATFSLHYYGRNALSGVHSGKPAALKTLATFTARTRRRLIEVIDILAGAHSGAIVVREAIGPEEAEVTRVLVYTVAEGLLATCAVYDQDQALIDGLVGQASAA